MKIVALIKQTPDTAELPSVSAGEVQSGDVQATMVINPWDEYAAEEAIELADRFDGDATAIALGSSSATDALKHALAMGIGSAALVQVDNPLTMDTWTAADLLVAAAKQEGNPDIVLTGKMSVDGNSGTLFAGVACKMDAPLIINVSKIVDVVDGAITVERLVDGGQETVRASLPVVLSVAKEINEPRYPSFMGIRKAGKAKIPTLTPDDLGVDASTATTTWSNIRKPNVETSDVQWIDGDSAQEKAQKLVELLIEEKAI